VHSIEMPRRSAADIDTPRSAPQKLYLLPRFVLPTHWLTAT
jgi:hypothetical protein